MTDEKMINVSSIKQKIDYHINEARKLQEALNLLLSIGADTLIYKKVEPNSTAVSQLTGTFKEIIKNILIAQNEPMLAKKCWEIINNQTNKNLAYNAFSAQLSALVKSGVIKKLIIEQNPIESRYYYGLPEWFQEGTNLIKDQYAVSGTI